MALANPEDQPALEAAATEFLKLCEAKKFKTVTVIQTSIAVGAAAILDEAAGDRAYAKQLLARYIQSFRDAVLTE
jgi:hypothetical protein